MIHIYRLFNIVLSKKRGKVMHDMQSGVTIGTIYYPLLLSLLGSMHCIGMCGGFSLLVSRENKSEMDFAWYQLGKFFGYAAVGSLVILFALVVNKASDVATAQFVLITLSGLLMLGYAIAGLRGQSLTVGINLPKWVQVHKIIKIPFLFGIMNGLIPCGLVYMLFASLPQVESPLNAYFMIFLFSLGTYPSLWLVKRVGHILEHARWQWIEKVLFVYLLIFAILTIMRGNDFTRPFVMKLPDLIRQLFILG